MSGVQMGVEGHVMIWKRSLATQIVVLGPGSIGLTMELVGNVKS